MGLVVQIGADMSKFEREFNRATKEIQYLGDKCAKAGASLTKNLTVPLTAVGIGAGTMAVKFEDSFAKVSTLLDSSKVDFDSYKGDILKASSESGIAVGDFSEAVYQSISAGVDQTKAIQFTTEAMKLAKAGFTSGASAVDVITTAINGYKLSTEDATRVSDMLITTQNLGKTTVDELSASMGPIIANAAAANFGIEELSASYALMTKNGIPTAQAGTMIKSMLDEITKSGSKSDKVLKELSGKGFAALKAEGKSTTEILGMLEKNAADSGMTLKDMFGSSEAGTAALNLMSGAGTEFNEMLGAMANSAGATEIGLEAVNASAGEKLRTSINALKNSVIEFGGQLVPIVTKAAEVIQALADKFSALTPAQQETILKVGLLVAALGPMLSLTAKAITTMMTLKKAFLFLKTEILGTVAAKVTDAAQTLYLNALYAKDAIVKGASTVAQIAHNVAVGAWNIIAGIAAAATTAFGAAVAFLTSPIGLAILAILAIIAAVYALWKNWDWVAAKAMEIGGIIASVFGAIWDCIWSVMSAIGEYIVQVWSMIVGIWVNYLTNILNTVVGIMSNIFAIIGSILTNIKNIFLAICEVIYGIVFARFNGYMNAIQIIMEGIKTVISNIMGLIKGIFTLDLGLIAQSVSGIFGGIWDTIKGLMGNICDTVKNSINAIIGFFDFEWSLPKLKMPHFSMSGKFSLIPPSVPSVSVDWYHDGAIFQRPTVLGGMGVGDHLNGMGRGAEAILPIDKLPELLGLDKKEQGGMTLNITNFNNNREQDIEQLCKELEFYRKRIAY